MGTDAFCFGSVIVTSLYRRELLARQLHTVEHFIRETRKLVGSPMPFRIERHWKLLAWRFRDLRIIVDIRIEDISDEIDGGLTRRPRLGAQIPRWLIEIHNGSKHRKVGIDVLLDLSDRVREISE